MDNIIHNDLLCHRITVVVYNDNLQDASVLLVLDSL